MLEQSAAVKMTLPERIRYKNANLQSHHPHTDID